MRLCHQAAHVRAHTQTRATKGCSTYFYYPLKHRCVNLVLPLPTSVNLKYTDAQVQWCLCFSTFCVCVGVYMCVCALDSQVRNLPGLIRFRRVCSRGRRRHFSSLRTEQSFHLPVHCTGLYWSLLVRVLAHSCWSSSRISDLLSNVQVNVNRNITWSHWSPTEGYCRYYSLCKRVSHLGIFKRIKSSDLCL